MKIKTNNILKFFILGFICFGLAASAVEVTQKLAIFSTICGLSILFKMKYRSVYLMPKSIYLFFLFYLYIFISFAWAPLLDFKAALSIMTIVLSSLLIGLPLYFRIVSLRFMILALLLPGLVNFICYTLEINIFIINHDGFEASTEAAMERFGGLTGHPNSLALRAVLPLILLCIYYKELIKLDYFKIIILPTCIFVALFSIYATGSKKSIFLFLICVYLILCNYKIGKKIIIFTSIALLILLINFYNYLDVTFLLQSDINSLVRIGEMLEGSDESTAERVYMQRVAPAIFLDNIFFGSGLNGFAQESGIGAYAHNNLLELASSSGLVGVILYYTIFFYFILKSYMKNGFYLSFGFLIMFLFMEFTSVIYMDRASVIVLVVFYFSLLIKRSEEENETDRNING